MYYIIARNISFSLFFFESFSKKLEMILQAIQLSYKANTPSLT